MKDQFKELLEIANRLHSPEGCPWDREQTFESLKPYVLEEAHELLDAVDRHSDAELIEELGDFLYLVIFYAKIAEKEGHFSIEDILAKLCEKLVRRHPHVFTEKKVETAEEAVQQWELVKKEDSLRYSSVLDSIAKTLPSLARAQKVISRMEKSRYPVSLEKSSEGNLTQALLNLAYEANRKGIDLEEGLRGLLQMEEERFRSWEVKNKLAFESREKQ